MDCPTEKPAEIKALLGDFPLIVGAGVTEHSVLDKLRYADGVIIGSWLKEGFDAYGEVSPSHVRRFMERVRSVYET